MTTTAARHIRNIPDDAPATAFAPAPVGAYRRGLRGSHLRQRLVLPLSTGQLGGEGVRAGHVAAAKMMKTKGQ